MRSNSTKPCRTSTWLNSLIILKTKKTSTSSWSSAVGRWDDLRLYSSLRLSQFYSYILPWPVQCTESCPRHSPVPQQRLILCVRACDAVVYSPTDGLLAWPLIHCSISAVPGPHLESEAHADGTRSSVLPQTDHIWPQVPPQQRNPAQRSQTRYASVRLKRGVHARTSIPGICCDFRRAYAICGMLTRRNVVVPFQATSLWTRTWSCGWETSASLPN